MEYQEVATHMATTITSVICYHCTGPFGSMLQCRSVRVCVCVCVCVVDFWGSSVNAAHCDVDRFPKRMISLQE